MDKQIIDERVTFICELGCARVREVIATLEAGKCAPETAQLNESEQRRVLQELQAIMAVYDQRA
jgi:hypothetical protein